MAQITFDKTRWPLVVVRYPDAFDEGDWDQLMQKIIAMVTSGQDYAMVNDARTGPPPTAAMRKQIADMYKTYRAEVEQHWRGTALIGTSPLIVGVMTALNWLTPPPHPVKVFRDYQEGETWALMQLATPGK